MGRKAFTVSVVVATIAWSIGLAALLMPLAAGAATLSSGDLIKASLPAVYYYGGDGKRYVFPNEKTYKTWYADFSSVKKITDGEIEEILNYIGTNLYNITSTDINNAKDMLSSIYDLDDVKDSL
jgi:hypothetical protein